MMEMRTLLKLFYTYLAKELNHDHKTFLNLSLLMCKLVYFLNFSLPVEEKFHF